MGREDAARTGSQSNSDRKAELSEGGSERQTETEPGLSQTKGRDTPRGKAQGHRERLSKEGS